MTSVIHASFAKPSKTTVVALHCSLGSGRQWSKLADELGRNHHFIAPDISGYGTNTCALELPLTLAEEVRCISGHLNDATGPIHLVGHSYGGAIAFKIATDSPYAHRVRSLTLIEPVLPTLLLETDQDRRLHARFAQLCATFPKTSGTGRCWKRSTSSSSSGTGPDHRIRCRQPRGCA